MRKVSISILVMAAMLGFGREAGAVSLCDADAGNLIQNCGFETGSMSPWTVAGTPDLAYNLVQINLIHSGTYAFEFANFASEGLAGPSQGISDVSGATYNFSFWLLSNDATDQQIQVFWNGTSLLELNGASFAWTQHTFQVVGTGSDTVTFLGFNDEGFNFVDDVQLDCVQGCQGATVPEPLSIVLLAAGLAGVAGFRHCRKRL